MNHVYYNTANLLAEENNKHNKINTGGIDFDDVLIIPRCSDISSRKDINLVSTLVCPHSGTKISGVPIVASNMDGVGTFNMGKALSGMELFTAINKHYTFNDITEYFNTTNSPWESTKYARQSFYTLGLRNDDIGKLHIVRDYLIAPLKLILLDVANGYTDDVKNMVSILRKENASAFIMVGNVCTPEPVISLIRAGASCVKVGIGCGSVCTTRDMTGVGVPQLSAILECAEAAHSIGGYICADGGCRTPGDVAKAFVGGADMVMLGNMLAGTTEGSVEILTDDNGAQHVLFYGMSSELAQEMYYTGVPIYGTAEGVEKLIPYVGDVSTVVHNILGGIRSACSYIGAHSIDTMHNGRFITQ